MVRIISPQYAKPFRRNQKNDGNDAEAICIAVMQPNMRFVPQRSIEQQDVQMLHRARRRLVKQPHGGLESDQRFLADRGIAFVWNIAQTRKQIPGILEDAENGLTASARETIAELFDLLRSLDERIANFDRRIDLAFRASEPAQRIARIEGVGPKIATAVVAAVGDGREFDNGRHMAAWLGLVPRQHSSGDRTQLFGISNAATSSFARSSCTELVRLCEPLPESPIRRALGSTDFGNAVASTRQLLPSRARTLASCGRYCGGKTLPPSDGMSDS
jgi:transposase